MSGRTELALESRVEAGPDRYAFRTADGVVSADEFRDEELALLGAVVPNRDDDVVVVDANYGVVGCILAHVAPGGRTVLSETSARAAVLCEGNLQRNGCEGEVALAADLEAVAGRFDVAAYAPRPYDPIAVGSQRCCGALARLRAGGVLYVAAAKAAGAKRYRAVLEELADAERVAKQGDVRVYRAVRPAEFEPRDDVEEGVVEATVRGVDRRFVTRPGLFSAGHLDGGTRLLLSALPVADGDRVLDLACGYGPVGVFAAGFADCAVTMTDDDAVAAAYARRNAERNGVAVEDVLAADGVDGVRGDRFDLVASNPPTHAGDGVVDALFRGARDVLADDGRFALVYNDVLAYEDRLENLFQAVEVVRAEDDFHVTVCRRPR
jgi:16S rRNA (guanine1207-N2)-methyltransferase